ncbi:MAG: DUF1501 domain-containing protein [Planctomycetaceae bacterium]
MTIVPKSDRRRLLQSTACGFGALALADLLAAAEFGSVGQSHKSRIPPPLPHFSPTAKRVMFLVLAGGVSQVDSFDYKPLLDREDGRSREFADSRSIARSGKGTTARVMRPLWPFHQRGGTGKWTSDLFPEMSRHVDRLCFLHGMHTDGVAHGPATLFLHTGTTTQIRPSVGSWVSYGLGTENDNLPAFVTLSPSLGNGGPRNFASGFLPAVHQGTAVGRADIPAKDSGIPLIGNSRRDDVSARRQFELVQALNRDQLAARGVGVDSGLEAIVESYELAWRMQHFAPSVLDLTGETRHTLDLYGIDAPETDSFGRQCLRARRLAEAGVRYIQVSYSDNSNNPAWDQHANMPKHAEHARRVDRPIAGLLTDLEARGLLDDTVVWWGGEFGRNPFAENNGTGRDHDPDGFTVWLAGGGVKRGYSFGATDEFGHVAVEGRTHMRDLHATLLHLLGLDHEQLTYRFAGRDFRLTDVAGEVIKPVLA